MTTTPIKDDINFDKTDGYVHTTEVLDVEGGEGKCALVYTC